MGGGGAAGSGSGVAEVMTVLMGAQRLSALSSLPVEKSDVHVAVGEELTWARVVRGFVLPEVVVCSLVIWLPSASTAATVVPVTFLGLKRDPNKT